MNPQKESHHSRPRREEGKTKTCAEYELITRAIRYLDECHTEQPDLAKVAQYVGLSQFHFHRLFSAWAAITPKDFLQFLTLSHARELLKKGESVLEAALKSGLSGPGRLHDLCVTLDAASPGELKSGGRGWTISAGFAASPFGTCLVAASPRGICHLSFAGPQGRRAEWAALREKWHKAQLLRDDSAASHLAGLIFERPDSVLSRPPLRAFVRGTKFQVGVWRALLQVRPGMLVSYGGLAASLGRPGAARAVGSAIGQNPLAYLIPCHRVIQETGAIGGYRWGQVRKRALLVWESCSLALRDLSSSD